MDEAAHDAEKRLRTLRALGARVDDLEGRTRAVSTSSLRHEVTNAVGAARNALILLGENPEPEAERRFMEMVERNVERATELLRGVQPDGAAASARDQRDDLGRPREREHGDTLGF